MSPGSRAADPAAPEAAEDSRARAARVAAARQQGRTSRRGRALARQRFLAAQAGEVDRPALSEAFHALLESGAAAPAAFPPTDALKWVPVGPSVVRHSDTFGRPRGVAGRIRDVWVDPVTGRRAYAASPKGGVWYTEDAGATWVPVGGWAHVGRSKGGPENAQSCGCLLVVFGAMAALDVVLVGTGETTPDNDRVDPLQAGVGVLAALGPVGAPTASDPWDEDTGTAQLEGLGIYRLARSPASRPWSDSGADRDVVIAATSAGAFVGTRQTITTPGQPDRVGFVWAPLAELTAAAGATPRVTDVLWMPGGQVVFGVANAGVVVGDSLHGTYRWVTGVSAPTTVNGRVSLAAASGTRAYALGEVQPPPAPGGVVPPNVPTLWQIADVTATPPVGTPLPSAGGAASGIDPHIWTHVNGSSQIDYDQAIAVDTDGGLDRVYVGGSAINPVPNQDESGSLWAYQVTAAPALTPAPNVSRPGSPAHGGDGALVAGYIGNTVHADIHVIRLVRPTDTGGQHVWVGCDGGVFVSTQAGLVNTFVSRNTSLSTLETSFVASHPTSSHFLIVGVQDNGAEVRVGDTVWDQTFPGDAGGVAFHPVYSQIVVAQGTNADWEGQPASEFLDPMTRQPGWGDVTKDRESNASAFYSGCATVAAPDGTSARLALGTNRVWVTDNLGGPTMQRWQVLPIDPAGTTKASDPRPGGHDLHKNQHFGVPNLGPVIALDWASTTRLVAAYAQGIVFYEQLASGAWQTTLWHTGPATIPAAARITDVAAVPNTKDFYVATTGDITNAPTETVYFFDSTAAGPNPFTATALRAKLTPLDPAYAVVVDPKSPLTVYAGTATGVWKGTRTPGVGPHAWDPLANGLPEATVQDLDLWSDPTDTRAHPKPDSPRLLRAAVQSRGVWETDLLHDTARVTYLRVHARDDRRLFPTPLANPRRRPGTRLEPVYASPDITVRPRFPLATAPRFSAGSLIMRRNAPNYELWTFQTAFRWRYPSVVASGVFTDEFGQLLVHERTRLGLPHAASPVIDAALWTAVVGDPHTPGAGIHLNANGTVTAAAGDDLAVYRAPWQTPVSPATLSAPATELDLLDLVVTLRPAQGVPTVYAEPCTVDVLLHHRDSRVVGTNGAYAALLWQSGTKIPDLLDAGVAGVQKFAEDLAAGNPPADPAGWTVVTTGVGPAAALHQLPVTLDAHLPRAVPIDVDLSGVPPDPFVLLLAISGSSEDHKPLVTPRNAPTTVKDLVQNWPYATCRIVRLRRRR